MAEQVALAGPAAYSPVEFLTEQRTMINNALQDGGTRDEVTTLSYHSIRITASPEYRRRPGKEGDEMNRSYVTRWVCWGALCFMLASGGCSSGSPTGSGAGGGTGGGAGGGGVTFTMTTNVDVGNNFFSPQNIQVSPRATVTWTWTATAGTHNVTFATGSVQNIGNQTGGSHSATMPAALDDYSYQCTIHSGMTGTVRVR